MENLTKDRRQTHLVPIRLFLVEKESGKPLSDVVVRVHADTSKASAVGKEIKSRERQQFALATLKSGPDGYLSFKLDRSTVAAASQLTVRCGASQSDAMVLNVVDLLTGNDTYTISLDPSALNIEADTSVLPAIMSPADIDDLTLSPGSIGLVPQLSRSLCSQLTPTLMGVRRFEAFHILVNDLCNPEVLSCPDQVKIVDGKMLEYEVAWHPAGTALGDLVNTITLAPCEQVNIAVVDWMRREATVMSTSTETQQQTLQQMDHDRLIVEAMQSSIKNKSTAWGVGGSLGLGKSKSAGFTGNKLNLSNKLNLTASFGGGYSSSTNFQNVALNTSNQLSEHITQAASFVASTHTSMVYQTTASEHQTSQTRVIRNHNHCHALTLMYYQINRNYRVVTEYKGLSDVILVKYDVKDFDAETAYCHAEVLKDALMDQSLLGCFDELADALFCCDLKPPTPPPPPASKVLMDSLRLTVDVRDVQGVIAQINIALLSGNQLLFNTHVGSWQNTSNVWPSGIHSHLFSINPPIDPALVDSVQISLGVSNPWSLNPPPSPPTAILNSIDITYKVAGQNNWLNIFSLQTGTTISNFWNTPVKPDLPTTTTTTPTPTLTVNECVENSCCIQKLLGHLNCHKLYYNTVLWLSEDPNERIRRWACCSKQGVTFNLIGMIENDPIAAYGDFLVFPVFGSQPTNGSVDPVSKLITMPTPGVYTEGILGQCNTCEKINPDVFWNWKDAPCPDNAPAISPPPAPQGSVKPGDVKTDAITNLITLSSVPSAPDSILKEFISSLVSKADAGSTEAKDLLEKLLDSIKASIPTSS